MLRTNIGNTDQTHDQTDGCVNVTPSMEPFAITSLNHEHSEKPYALNPIYPHVNDRQHTSDPYGYVNMEMGCSSTVNGDLDMREYARYVREQSVSVTDTREMHVNFHELEESHPHQRGDGHVPILDGVIQVLPNSNYDEENNSVGGSTFNMKEALLWNIKDEILNQSVDRKASVSPTPGCSSESDAHRSVRMGRVSVCLTRIDSVPTVNLPVITSLTGAPRFVDKRHQTTKNKRTLRNILQSVLSECGICNHHMCNMSKYRPPGYKAGHLTGHEARECYKLRWTIIKEMAFQCDRCGPILKKEGVKLDQHQTIIKKPAGRGRPRKKINSFSVNQTMSKKASKTNSTNSEWGKNVEITEANIRDGRMRKKLFMNTRKNGTTYTKKKYNQVGGRGQKGSHDTKIESEDNDDVETTTSLGHKELSDVVIPIISACTNCRLGMSIIKRQVFEGSRINVNRKRLFMMKKMAMLCDTCRPMLEKYDLKQELEEQRKPNEELKVMKKKPSLRALITPVISRCKACTEGILRIKKEEPNPGSKLLTPTELSDFYRFRWRLIKDMAMKCTHCQGLLENLGIHEYKS